MAGEPESLHTKEPLKQRTIRHDYDRLLMLSDGVFAIAITLLALDLTLPVHWDGSLEGLASATGRPLIGYLFGFVLVGAFWFMHRRTFAQMEQVDGAVTVLNLLLLGLVGLTPFVARMIAEAGPTRAMPFYLVEVAGVLGSVALIRGWGAMRPRLLHVQVDRQRWRRELLHLAATALVLGGVGAWAIVEHQKLTGNMMVALIAVLAGSRALLRRFGNQRSSTNRP
jgi:uncharacterized membrane protein